MSLYNTVQSRCKRIGLCEKYKRILAPELRNTALPVFTLGRPVVQGPGVCRTATAAIVSCTLPRARVTIKIHVPGGDADHSAICPKTKVGNFSSYLNPYAQHLRPMQSRQTFMYVTDYHVWISSPFLLCLLFRQQPPFYFVVCFRQQSSTYVSHLDYRSDFTD